MPGYAGQRFGYIFHYKPVFCFKMAFATPPNPSVHELTFKTYLVGVKRRELLDKIMKLTGQENEDILIVRARYYANRLGNRKCFVYCFLS